MLALSEKMVLSSQSKQARKQKKLPVTSVSSKLSTNPSKSSNKAAIALMPSLARVLEMGFSVESVQHALNELGEDTRAERLVSWLLQHPEVQKVCNFII